MMSKRILYLSLLLLFLPLLLPSANAARGKLISSKFNSETVYYAQSKIIDIGIISFNITVATPQGVDYGVYTARYATYPGSVIPVTSWSGTGTAPIITMVDYSSASNTRCPGMDTSTFTCAEFVISIEVSSDNYGCPWIATISATTTTRSFGFTYTGPITRDSICPTVPVDTYDISWDPNVLKHDTVLSIDSTGGTVKSTLQTYLMESGSLCDKSKMDSRGAYCRFVGTGVRLTVKGCDNGT